MRHLHRIDAAAAGGGGQLSQSIGAIGADNCFGLVRLVRGDDKVLGLSEGGDLMIIQKDTAYGH